MNDLCTRWLRGVAVPFVIALAACSSSGKGNGGTGGALGGAAMGTSGAGGTITGAAASGAGTGAFGTGSAGRTSFGTAGSSARGSSGSGASGMMTMGQGTAGTTTNGTAGMSGSVAGKSGAAGGAAGTTAGASGSNAAIVTAGSCTPPPMGPAITDYGAMGPFAVMEVSNTGPSGQYTMFRPTMLGMGGFLHPPVTWGNGVTTTPDLYVALLTTVASHGFVVIASNSTGVTAQDVQQGLDWLIMQNDAAGDFQGKLAVKCAGAIGYSMGGGAAVGAAADPAVIATVSMHGLQGDANALHGPLLLMTSTNDGFVTKEGFVKPTYDASTKVPTIMATENVPGAAADFSGHLLPLGDSGNERAPLVAWLRLFIYGDEGTKDWFYGADCRLCKDPWIDIQRKNGMW